MPRFTYLQNSFNSGELSPKLDARTDLKQYAQGASEITNFIPYKTGGLSFRPAFRYFSDTLSVTDVTKIANIPFSFSRTENYKIIIDLSTSTITAEDTDGNSVTVSTSALCDLALAEVTSDPEGFAFAQTADVLVITHNSGLLEPLIILRLDSTVGGQITQEFLVDIWSQDFATFTPTFPVLAKAATPLAQRVAFLDANLDLTHTMQTSANVLGATTVITSSSAIFTTKDIGSHIMLDDGGGTAKIQVCSIFLTAGTVATPATTCTAVVIATEAAFPTATNTDFWYRGAWSKLRGYPRSVTIFENRFIFGGTPSQPDSLFGSATFGYFEMNRFIEPERTATTTFAYDREGGTGERPFEITIASNSIDSISWLSSDRTLLVGTTSREYTVQGSEGALARDNINIQPRSSHGSGPFRSQNAGQSTYFISRDGSYIHQIGFTGEQGGYSSTNLSLLSDEILHHNSTDRSSRFVKIAWQECRYILWALTNNGDIFSISINDSTGTTGWQKHLTPDMTVHDIMVLPNTLGDYDDIHLLASHADTASGTIFSLKLVNDFENVDLFNTSTREEDEAIFLDFGIQLGTIGAPTTTFSLPTAAWDGMTVSVLLEDGTIETGIAVASASITVSASVDRVILGIPYAGRLETMNLEVGPNDTLNSQGDIRRIDRATVKAYKSRSGSIGTVADGDISPLDDFENMVATAATTESFHVDLPGSAGLDNRVIIENNKPLPLNILGIVMRGVANS